MKPLVSALLILLSLGSVAAASAGGAPYLNLSSAQKMPNSWDYYEQVEHKGDNSDSDSNVCANKEDLLNNFPVKDGSGLYWDYISASQQGRLAEQIELGSIDGVKITEIVLRFQQPVDYIKILNFTPSNTNLLCPFATIAELSSQLQYAKSELIEYHGTMAIKTAMVDNIAFKSPRALPFYFQLNGGLPHKIDLNERRENARRYCGQVQPSLNAIHFG